MSQGLFLEDDELVKLTARRYKSKQIEWLRAAGIPFRVSATGDHARYHTRVITRAAAAIGAAMGGDTPC